MKRMVLEFWIRNKKLFTIKKCKGKLRNNWLKSCKKSERKRINSNKSLLLLNKKFKKTKILKINKNIKPQSISSSKMLTSKNRQFSKLQKINKNNKNKVTNKMRIYKTRLKIHKQKVKTINNKTIAKNNLHLIKRKKVHPSKISKISNKRKILTTICQSFKNKPKNMIDWYFCNFLLKWHF